MDESYVFFEDIELAIYASSWLACGLICKTGHVATATIECGVQSCISSFERRYEYRQVQYILCIRPNMENDPVLFEDEYVTQQLLSASIVEAAQVCGWRHVAHSIPMRALLRRNSGDLSCD